MTVSGTTSTTVFRTQRVIDEAIRNCRLTAQQITSEILEEAKNKLYLILSELANEGIPLWCIEKQILPLYQGNPHIYCPNGTVTVLNANLRTLQRLTAGTATASEGVAANAFDGDLTTACVQTSPAGNITFEYDATTSPTCFGILPNATGSWDFVVETSLDGTTYHPVYTTTAYSAIDGEWLWFDLLDPLTIDQSEYLNDIYFVRLRATGTTILNVTEFYISNRPTEIPLAPINRDDYMNLPDKTFQGRPVQFWLNRQRDIPVLEIWPAPNLAAVFQQVTMYTQRYIMDVGTLSQSLDIPQRWYSAVVDQLAWKLSKSRKEVNINLIPDLKQDAIDSMKRAWGGETDGAPVYFRPNISPYTR